MPEHLPECPKSGCEACYEQGKHDCKATHAIRGLKDINRIATRGYDDGQRDALLAAQEAIEGLLKEWWELFEGTPSDLKKEFKSMQAINRCINAIDALRKEHHGTQHQ